MRNNILFYISARPLHVIEFILSTSSVLYGMYVLSPYYVVSQSAIIGTAFDSPITLTFLGILFIAVGGFMIYGLIRDNPKIRSQGLLFLFMSLVFICLLRLVNLGFFPLGWFFPFVCALIAGVLRINIQLGGRVWTRP